MHTDKHRLKKGIIAALFVCSSIYSYGQDVRTEHVIDKQLNACLDSAENQTTLGMIECTIRAEDLWDVELNKYYKLLMGVLNKEQKILLKDAQVKWLAYRDSELNLSSDIYYGMEGTMWRIVYADRRMEIVKKRAEELRIYYEALKL